MYGMILLIIAVISLSGLISYLGDRIGMKVGKKRISLFGLRPKYTSIIITIMTGILIAALTLTIIFITNNVVRQAVFRIEEVVSRINTLNSQLDNKDQQLTEMQSNIADMNSKLRDLNQQKEKLDRELARSQNELEIARQDITELSKKRDSLEESNQKLEAKNLELQKLNDQLEETNQQLQQENQDLLQENKQLESENTTLSRQNNELVKQNHTLQTQNQQLTEQSNQLKDRIEAQKTQISALEEEIKDITGQFEAARNLTMHYSVGDIVYQRGDIIYTGVIDGGMTGDQTVEALTQLLKKADQEVQKKQVKVNEELGTALYLQEDEILAVARAILNAESKRVIVRVIASLNVLVGERVMADLVPIEDFVVFNAGEQLSEKVIDASKDTGQLEKDLEDILTDIRIKAVKRGLLEDQQRGVITIDFYRFYQLVKDIQQYQGKIRLRVQAREDIWRENRLSSNLEFKIISMNEQPAEANNQGSTEGNQ